MGEEPLRYAYSRVISNQASDIGTRIGLNWTEKCPQQVCVRTAPWRQMEMKSHIVL